MMNNTLETALRVAQLGDLPPAIDDAYKKHWLKAIVKIQRSNGEIGYCLAVNDGNNKPRIIRDFNPTGIIVRVLSVHPYEESTRNIIPSFRSDEQILNYFRKTDFKREEIESLLSKEGKTSEQIKADRELLNSYITQVAIGQAIRVSNANAGLKKFADMADPNLKDKNAKAKKYGRTATPRKTKRSKSED